MNLSLTLCSIVLIFVNIVITKSNSPFTAKCNKTNRGQRQLYQNRLGNDGLLVCLRKDGVYRWTFLDGTPSLGEIFDPARDCSDIVDNLPKAKDGFYWIFSKKGRPVKVWCDVHTDGGGFMLVGMMDSPDTLTVPSNSNPVDPKGPPHWSSAFGDFDVLDFGIQVSNSSDFKDTKAHWFYRLNSERHLGRLLMDSKGGCSGFYSSGIGDILSVKDIPTGTVVTRDFRCSKFGAFSGWRRMNNCFQQDCKQGFAYLFSFKFHSDGSFSYSASSSFSGVTHDATAFVGCDIGKCCACFGPKGGRRNYCTRDCKSINGGTVTKRAFVWFWIRSKVPKQVWKRCMEFKIKSKDGKIENHFIDSTTGYARKGSCSKKFNTLLYEGTILSPKLSSLQNIPAVPGLLSYRSDIKQLYVNNGSHWNALSSKTEVLLLELKVKSLQKAVVNLSNRRSCSDIRNMNLSLPSGFYSINPEGKKLSSFNVYCDMTSKNGIGVTAIGHDSERETLVETRHLSFWTRTYKRKVTYDVSMDKIQTLINTSKYCEQFIKYRCYSSRITNHAWWVSRQGSRMNYWGGAAVNSGKCKCGMTNSCAGGGNCNCDVNDFTFREDSGFLTDKKTLPVTELQFRDAYGKPIEYGYHTLGKLLCYG